MKILAPLFLLAISNILVAQTSEPVESISKGTKFIGGSFSFSTTKIEDSYQSTNASIGPVIGFYIKDDLALGGVLSYSTNTTEYLGTNSSTSFSGIGLSAFLLRNYRMGNNLFFTLQPQASFSFSKQKYSSIPTTNNYSNFDLGVGISPGILFFINRKFALQTSLGSLGYSFSRRKQETISEPTNTHSFGLNGALAMSSFSIRYFIW